MNFCFCGLRFIHLSKVVVFVTWIFSPVQNVFAEKFFYKAIFSCFLCVKCLSAQERMYANIHISWYMLNRAGMGIFRSKNEVKSSKSFWRGNFLFVPFNPLFYVWTMCQCFKNNPAKFQSRPAFLAGFFSKRVTNDDDWRKTFFLASCSEYSFLNYHVVTMEYRTGDRDWQSGSACASALRELSQLSSSFFPSCASWASNFCAWPCRRHPTFLSKRRSGCSNKHSVTWSFLFEASGLSTRCGKVRVQSQHRRSSSCTSCRSRRGKQSCTQWSCLVSSQGMIAWRGWSNRKGGWGVSVLFSFVSVDSCSSTGERKTGSATWDWQEHPAFVCFVSFSLSLSLSLSLSFFLSFFLSLSLSLSLSLCLCLSKHALPFFSSPPFPPHPPSSRSMNNSGLAALQQRSHLGSRSVGDACRLSWVDLRQCCTYKQKPEWGKKKKLKLLRQEKEIAHQCSAGVWRLSLFEDTATDLHGDLGNCVILTSRVTVTSFLPITLYEVFYNSFFQALLTEFFSSAKGI